MVATVGSISIDLSTNVAKFSAGFRSAATTVEQQSNRMARGISVAQRQFESFARTAAISLGGALSTRTIYDYANAWVEAGNKLRAAGEISGIQTRSIQRLNEIATKTRSGLVETVDLYAKLIRTGSGVARSEQEIADATEIINKAFKAGGAAASEQAAGILQLSQALGSGFLQGDELRSIRENAPLLAKAIADEFGVTIGGLKALGAAGEITSERVFRAILKARNNIDKAFDKTRATLADNIEILKNSGIQFVGTFDNTTGAIQGTANAIQKMTDEVTRLDTAMANFGQNGSFENFLHLLFGFQNGDGTIPSSILKAYDAITRESHRSTAEIQTDIDKVQKKLDDLRIDAKAGFVVDLEIDRALQDLRTLQDELQRTKIAAAAAAANPKGSLSRLVNNALGAMDKQQQQATKPLPGVTYGNDLSGTAGGRSPGGVVKKDVNGTGVGVTSFGDDLSDTSKNTKATSDNIDRLDTHTKRYFDGLSSDLGGYLDGLDSSINDGTRVINTSIDDLQDTLFELFKQGITDPKINGSVFGDAYDPQFGSYDSSFGIFNYGKTPMIEGYATETDQFSISRPGTNITLNYNAAPGESERTARQRAREMWDELNLQASRA